MTDPLHVVAAVIVRDDGAVLVCRRAPGKASAGLWEFPGGKVDDGETPEEALVREIGEELGAIIRVGQQLSSDVTEVGERAIRLSCYLAVLEGAAPVASTDHDRPDWVAPEHLGEREWSAPDLPAVGMLTARASRA